VVTPGKPAVSLAAVPRRRQATIEMARRLEQEGFTGLYCPSLGDGLGLCEAIALSTREIPFGSSIANMYARHPYDFAQTAAFLHEVSGGRFRFGIGVAHAPSHIRMGVTPGKPLGDIRAFVDKFRSYEGIGALPPIVMILVYLTTPGYISLLWTHPTGQLMLVGCVVWMAIGIMVMKKMINFDF